MKNIFVQISNRRRACALAFVCLALCCGAWVFSGSSSNAAEKHETDVCTRPGARAMLCSDCAFGNRKDNCVKCGKWMAGSQNPAYLCNDCAFGTRKDNCVKCGRWIGGRGVPACICNDCAFGNRKENCVKCGKWMGGN